MNNNQQSCTNDNCMSRTQEQGVHTCKQRGTICSLQCESLKSHLQVRISEAEMLYFHSKLPDAARGTNSEDIGNVFGFVWAYKIKCTCFQKNFCPSLLAKSKKKLNLTKNAWLLAKIQSFFVDVTIIR